MCIREMTGVFLVLAAMLLASGCALSNHVVSEPYQPSAAPIAQAPNHTLAVSVNAPNGTRPNAKVGVVKNGFGWSLSEVVVGPELDQWLSTGLSSEFQRAGFRVGSAQDGAAFARVEVTARQLMAEPAPSVGGSILMGVGTIYFIPATWYGSAAAITEFDVTVIIPATGRRFERRFVGLASSGDTSFSTEILEQLFRQALREAYGDIVTETAQLVIHGN